MRTLAVLTLAVLAGGMAVASASAAGAGIGPSARDRVAAASFARWGELLAKDRKPLRAALKAQPSDLLDYVRSGPRGERLLDAAQTLRRDAVSSGQQLSKLTAVSAGVQQAKQRALAALASLASAAKRWSAFARNMKQLDDLVKPLAKRPKGDTPLLGALAAAAQAIDGRSAKIARLEKSARANARAGKNADARFVTGMVRANDLLARPLETRQLKKTAPPAPPGRRVPLTATTPNLVENPGAELGAPSKDGADVVSDVPFWVRTGAFNVVAYGASTPVGGLGPFPRKADLDAKLRGRAGEALFAGGPAAADSSAIQVIDLAGLQELIATGKARVELSALLGGTEGQRDKARVEAIFLDEAGNELGARLSAGPVGVRQRRASTTLQTKSATGPVPPATRSISVLITALWNEGLSNEGYADDIRVRLILGL